MIQKNDTSINNSRVDIHWSKIKEVGGGLWHFRFMLWTTSHLPLWCVKYITAIISFFFWLFAPKIKKRSLDFFEHWALIQNKKIPFLATYKHIFSFSLSMIEKLLGFRGAIDFSEIKTEKDDLNELVNLLNQKKGAFLICSHLGNMEMLRSLTGYGKFHTNYGFKVFPVVDFSGTTKFNQLLKELNPDLMDIVIDANKIGIESAVWMKEKINEGNLIVIAGDRTSKNFINRSIEIDFLGEIAKFPEGAFNLAGILKEPIFFAFALRKNDFSLNSSYEFHITKAKTDFKGGRKERKENMNLLAREFSNLLEYHCKKHPYQWYNFFNFWAK